MERNKRRYLSQVDRKVKFINHREDEKTGFGEHERKTGHHNFVDSKTLFEKLGSVFIKN